MTPDSQPFPQPHPPAIETLTLRVRGLTLSALAWGPQHAPPVLALHGWMDNAATFSTLAPLLRGLRIVALDCPGHGHSDWLPPAASYDFIAWLGLPFEVADALGWHKLSLVGHSMGAALSSLAAGAIPERVSRLVLLEGAGPLTAPESEAPRRLRNAIEKARAPRPSASYPSQQAATERLQAALPGLSHTSAALLVQRGTRPQAERFVWRADPRLRSPSSVRLTEGQVHAFLRNIAAPTLFVRAEHGFPFPEPGFGERLRQLRQLQQLTVPGHHHVHLDHPERVAPEIQSFLSPAPEPSP